MVINQDKFGLLDFQDALIGSPAYDFLSLLEDARRDIKFDIAKSLFQYLALCNHEYLPNSIKNLPKWVHNSFNY